MSNVSVSEPLPAVSSPGTLSTPFADVVGAVLFP